MKTLKKLKEIIKEHGEKICKVALMIVSIAPVSCRYYWYEPEKPEGLEEFLHTKGY